MRLGSAVFQEDTELDEPFSIMGPVIAKKKLKAFSINSMGPMTIGSDFEVKSFLKVNGPLKVGGTFSCDIDCKARVNGPLKVGKGIIGGSMRVNGPIKAEYIDIYYLKVNGPVNIVKDIQVKEEIIINIGYSSKTNNPISVGGLIEAPIVYFKSSGKFSDRIPGYKTLRKVFGLNPKYQHKIVLQNLRISAEVLRLQGVEIIDSEIDVDKIEDLDTEY